MRCHAPRSAADRRPAPPTLQAKADASRGLEQGPAAPAIGAKLAGFSFADVPVHASPAPAPGQAGLPEGLKAGVEALSGLTMDDVRVHRNSAEPAKLGALAYAQGSDIHLGPGQEEHLPHEAWHVVQQKQGRVAATRQFRGGAVNDSPNFEREADRMGREADRITTLSSPKDQGATSSGVRQASPSGDRADAIIQPKLSVGSKGAEVVVKTYEGTALDLYLLANAKYYDLTSARVQDWISDDVARTYATYHEVLEAAEDPVKAAHRYDGDGERVRKPVDKSHVGKEGLYLGAQNGTGSVDPILDRRPYVLERDELPKFQVHKTYAGGNAIDVCEGGALAQSAYLVKGPLDPKAGDPMFVEGAWALASLEIGEIERKYRKDGVKFVDASIGLEAALYVNVHTGEYALSFAGTNDIWDVIADAAQLKGMSIQHAQALNLSLKVDDYLKGESLTFVGHSLGGGEAMLAHYATGRPASVYNPAWITDATLDSFGLERDAGLPGVTVNIVSGEIVNALQSNSGKIAIGSILADLPGVAMTAMDVEGVRGGEGGTIFYTDPTPLTQDDFSLKGMAMLSVERHLMDRVMKAIMAYPDQSRLYKQAPKPIYRGGFVR